MEEIREAVRLCLKADLPVMLWGAPGVGKSSVVRQLAQEGGIGLIDLRLSQMSPVDLRGAPVPDHASGRTRWYPPSELPDIRRDGEKGILFLDELPNAPRDVQVGALQLVLDRRLGEYGLPAGWRVVAAGNRVVDRAGSYQIVSSLANRMVHIPVACGLPPMELTGDGVSVDVNAWKVWAYSSGLREEVIAFLSFRSDLLWRATGQVAYATPRTWEYVSRLLDAGGGKAAPLAVRGCVGDAPGKEFLAFLEVRERMPDPDAIIAGKEERAPGRGEPDVAWAVCVALAVRMLRQKKKGRDKLVSACRAVMRYLERLDADFQVFLLTELFWNARVGTEIANLPEFAEWRRRHPEVFAA